jgi:hypothetical protein
LNACAKCKKPFNFLSISYDSETVYRGDNYTLSLNEKYPEHPYRGMKLCGNCYKEVYDKGPVIASKKFFNDNEDELKSGMLLRGIVCSAFTIAFIVSIIGIASLPSAVWNLVGFGQLLGVGLALFIGLCAVLLSYWVWNDGSQLTSLRETVNLLKQEVDKLNSKKQEAEPAKSTN